MAAETWDGWLNDINGFHVTDQHVFGALDAASGGPVAEGSGGGGTGMICCEFKGGIGTSSRIVERGGRWYTVGALPHADFGRRSQLTIAGAPVGRKIPDLPAYGNNGRPDNEQGPVIVVVGTDAPLLPHQLKRLARRVSLGLARTGAVSGNGSGDLFLAFSTANKGAWSPAAKTGVEMLGNGRLDAVFAAVRQRRGGRRDWPHARASAWNREDRVHREDTRRHWQSAGGPGDDGAQHTARSQTQIARFPQAARRHRLRTQGARALFCAVAFTGQG